jgi:hypothetical protein
MRSRSCASGSSAVRPGVEHADAVLVTARAADDEWRWSRGEALRVARRFARDDLLPAPGDLATSDAAYE